MEKILIVFSFIYLLIGCNENRITKNFENKKNIIIDTFADRNSENKLKFQLTEYYTAYLNADIDKVLYYMYSDVFEYQKYKFPNGLPKIHEHDNKPAQGFGLFWQGKLVCFYDYETDLGEGWEDIEVHNDTVEQHTKALQMGANIIQYLCIY